MTKFNQSVIPQECGRLIVRRMSKQTTFRLLVPTAVGFMVGLLFLIPNHLGHPLPGVLNGIVEWLDIVPIGLWVVWCESVSGPNMPLLDCLVVFQWSLLGVLVGSCWLCFGRSHEKPSA